jgi:hypothetical protein
LHDSMPKFLKGSPQGRGSGTLVSPSIV